MLERCMRCKATKIESRPRTKITLGATMGHQALPRLPPPRPLNATLTCLNSSGRYDVSWKNMAKGSVMSRPPANPICLHATRASTSLMPFAHALTQPRTPCATSSRPSWSSMW